MLPLKIGEYHPQWCYPNTRKAAHIGPVSALAVASSGLVIASGGDDGKVIVRPLGSAGANWTAEHEGPIIDLSWNPVGDCIAAGVGGVVKIWDGATGECMSMMRFDGPVRGCRWTSVTVLAVLVGSKLIEAEFLRSRRSGTLLTKVAVPAGVDDVRCQLHGASRQSGRSAPTAPTPPPNQIAAMSAAGNMEFATWVRQAQGRAMDTMLRSGTNGPTLRETRTTLAVYPNWDE